MDTPVEKTWNTDDSRNVAAALTWQAERQPNVIILLADDLGPYEVSAYGVEHAGSVITAAVQDYQSEYGTG